MKGSETLVEPKIIVFKDLGKDVKKDGENRLRVKDMIRISINSTVGKQFEIVVKKRRSCKILDLVYICRICKYTRKCILSDEGNMRWL